jgi:hypothetical protein
MLHDILCTQRRTTYYLGKVGGHTSDVFLTCCPDASVRSQALSSPEGQSSTASLMSGMQDSSRPGGS